MIKLSITYFFPRQEHWSENYFLFLCEYNSFSEEGFCTCAPCTLPLDPTLMVTFVEEPIARRMEGEVVGSRLHLFVFVFFQIRLCSPYSFDQLALYPKTDPLHNPSLIWELRHFYVTPDVLWATIVFFLTAFLSSPS